MTWQELIPVLVIFSSVVSILGSVPSSRREQDVRSVKTYRIPSNPGTTRTVTIADDRIEVVVSIDALAANRSRIIEQLGKLRGISRALDKRVQALEKMNHRDGAPSFYICIQRTLRLLTLCAMIRGVFPSIDQSNKYHFI